MTDKEILIDLIRQFANMADAIDACDEDDEEELNNKLIEMSLKIEEATIPVFGRKVQMDFGMSHAVWYHTEGIIKSIEDFEIEK